MADDWDEGRAGLLLWDAPPLIHVNPQKADQPPATGKSRRKQREARTLLPAADKPVARVAVDMSQPHLDRPFDYLVPAKLADQALPGVRVRVRFSGTLVDGIVVERGDDSDFSGELRYLERVLSAEQVLTDEIAALARAVADRYGGSLADVLRLAIPPRHAATEAAPAALAPELPPRPAPGPWTRYPAGPSFLDALAVGRPARAAWTALPGPGWPQEIARAAVTAASAGRGVVIVVPDARDLARVDEALAALTPPSSPVDPKPSPYVTLTAELGPAERYRRWLAALRGQALIVAGTRAAMFAPVANLGLVVLWDDGDDMHADLRAPYPHAREVLALRAHRAGAAALIGGFARTAEMTQLVRSGWAMPLRPDRRTLRAVAPRVMPAAEEAHLDRDSAALTARLPTLALRTARQALETGPVLIQVPRNGYLAAIACAGCRLPARCTQQHSATGLPCNGPLRLAGPGATPDCRWCGALAAQAGGWHCPACGRDQLRALVTGAARTAEEFGRAFPGVKVRTSGGDLILPRVPDKPALVIATPGAEPLADYAAALLLDGWALLSLPGLRAGEETVRRWLAAAALVRPGGTVLVHADAGLAATQALMRWDPVTFAERDLAERSELGFPPAVRMAAVTGDAAAVASLLHGVGGRFEVLGPVPVEAGKPSPTGDEEVRALVRAPRADGAALAAALQSAQAGRFARKEAGLARVQLDPPDLI
jgi:primosomal protein N' (replication factor Y)